jgi:hypothetical protein
MLEFSLSLLDCATRHPMGVQSYSKTKNPKQKLSPDRTVTTGTGAHDPPGVML